MRNSTTHPVSTFFASVRPNQLYQLRLRLRVHPVPVTNQLCTAIPYQKPFALARGADVRGIARALLRDIAGAALRCAGVAWNGIARRGPLDRQIR